MHVLHILWFFFFIPPRKRSDILLFVRFCSYRSFLILFSLEFLSNYFLFHFFHSPSFIERPFKSLKIQQGSFQSLRASLFIVDTQKIHWSEHMMDLGLHLLKLISSWSPGVHWTMNKEFTCFHWLWKELVTLCQILCTLRRNYFNRSWCDIQQILLSFPCPPSSKINTWALQYIILIFHSTFAFHISWCCLAISILSETTLPNSPCTSKDCLTDKKKNKERGAPEFFH